MGFDDFWNGNESRGWKRYPRRVRKRDTEKEYWTALEDDDVTHEVIMNGVQRCLRLEYRRLIAEQKIYLIPSSDKWLSDGRFWDHEGADDGECGLAPEQIQYWQRALANGSTIPEGIKKLLPQESNPLLRVVK